MTSRSPVLHSSRSLGIFFFLHAAGWCLLSTHSLMATYLHSWRQHLRTMFFLACRAFRASQLTAQIFTNGCVQPGLASSVLMASDWPAIECRWMRRRWSLVCKPHQHPGSIIASRRNRTYLKTNINSCVCAHFWPQKVETIETKYLLKLCHSRYVCLCTYECWCVWRHLQNWRYVPFLFHRQHRANSNASSIFCKTASFEIKTRGLLVA